MRLFSVITISVLTYLVNSIENICHIDDSPNNCIQFTVSSGTGCQWMCSYCQQLLGTTNYYFTDNICKYETGGCVGTPQIGVKYTCCSA